VVLHVSHLRYIARMKNATIPAVRVEPELRSEIEALLDEGESLSQFVESAVRARVAQRRHDAEFMARGLAAVQRVKQGGPVRQPDEVVAALERRLQQARDKHKRK
jgi:hypothetical protein